MQKARAKHTTVASGRKTQPKKTSAASEDLLDQAREAAHATVQSSASLAEDLKTSVADAASDIGATVADKAEKVRRDATQTVRASAQDAAERGKGETQKYVRSIGRALGAGSRSLEDDGLVGTAGYVRAAGRGLENAADEINGLDTGGLTERVESFVRDRPMMTVGLLAVAGFAIASTLKSSNGPANRRS